jgi:hypothetical protein
METSPLVMLGAGAGMVGVGILLILIFFVTRAAPSIFPGAALILFGSIILFRGWLSMQASLDGGDIVWILRDDGIEVRTPLGKSTWPWERITYALYERGWFAPRLSFGATFASGMRIGLRAQVKPTDIDSLNEVAIWLGRGDGDGRAVIQHIKERIAGAREAGSTENANANAKPASPPPPLGHNRS